MKKLLILLSIISTSFVNAQEFPISEKTGKVSYEGVVKLDSLSSSDIYIRANEWFAKSYNSAKSVIQMNDAVSKKIIGKGEIQVYYIGSDAGKFLYTISFFAKEGRYKYIITDIYHVGVPGTNYKSAGMIKNEIPDCGKFNLPKRLWIKHKDKAEKHIQVLISNLNQYMNETNVLDDDDW
jgi:hypothetical protein